MCYGLFVPYIDYSEYLNRQLFYSHANVFAFFPFRVNWSKICTSAVLIYFICFSLNALFLSLLMPLFFLPSSFEWPYGLSGNFGWWEEFQKDYKN